MTIHANKELCARLETVEALNQVEFAVTFNRLEKEFQAAYKKIGTGYAVFAGVDSPLTQAFALGLDGEVSEKEILELEDFYKQRGSAVNIEVCTLSDISLARLLVERGFQITEYSNLLVRSLAGEETFEQAGEIVIREVRADELDRFAATVGRGFAEGSDPSESITELFKVWFEQSNCTWFGAFVDREMAGGGAVFLNQGVGEFGGASTLPEYRGRGIQTALLKARLAYARKNGCDLAMVTTLPGTTSQRNVEKQGFQVAYTRTKFTKQPPPKQDQGPTGC